ncbi:MAG: chromosome segregation protein SMC [Chloroflexi bacterium]|nr:chromosome segregation protein SMC [Chloroflexota bacterium]
MKLKRLELQGYKTFASRTVFEFDSGITAIVGPNGSGKSNIADAVRWVLGEQSYTTLRGKRTTDMIFAGSHDRPRAGMAQVILTLDNSDGWLPIDYSEVVIGRRAFRSGENEYLLNGQKVRLRDVQELLATSGLGERTYTIVGQGLIDQALSLRPEERRALFEEAAGVSHYQAKRATTLRRLQETQHNLERIHDILSEIRPRLGGLKRQANRARNYEQIQNDLRHLLRIWYGYQWETRKAGLREQRQRAQDAEADWQESRTRLAELLAALDTERRQLNAVQRQVGQLRQEREGLREQHDNARRHIAILRERASLLAQQHEELQNDRPRLEEQKATAAEQLAGAVAELAKAQEHLQAQERHLLAFNQSFQDKQAEIDRATAEVQRLEQAVQVEQRRLSQAEGQLGQLRERLQERRSGDAEAEAIRTAASEDERLEQVAATVRQELEALSRRHRDLQSSQQAARSELSALRQRLDAETQRLNQMNENAARLEARCEMLDQMRQRDAVTRKGVAVLGRLASLVHIPAAHQEAVEAALGARLAALVLPDSAALWSLLEQNESAVLHAVSAADARPARRNEKPDGPGILGWASELVSANGAPRAVVDLLLGPVLLVAGRREAYAIAPSLPPGTMAVAPDGFVVHAGGLVEVNPRDPQRSILAREEAWRAADAEVRAQREALKPVQEAVAALQKEVEERQKQLSELERDERQHVRAIQEGRERQNEAQRRLDRARQQLDFLQRQEAARQQEVEQLAERIDSTEQTLQQHQSELARLDLALEGAREKLGALPIAEAEQERRNRRQGIETARTIVAGREAVVESRRATLSQIESQLQRLEKRLQAIAIDQRELDLDGAQQRVDRVQSDLDKLDARLHPLLARLEEKQNLLEKLEADVARAQRRTHDLETYYTQMKVALSQHENALEGLIERIRNDLGLVALDFDEERGGQSPLPIDEIVEQLPVVTEVPEDIEASIRDYRGQLHRLGLVNPDAPEEYQQTQERYEFLTRQVEDLQETEKRLRQVIAELDDLTSRAFAETVENVDRVFGEIFTRLFGGGSARLVLTEPDDLTISGVDIIARLPNRRQQRLGLLSGGERSLTATALLFALLQVAPPPFSMLDEVDAMLDEANVTRFRGVLRDLSQNTQFIVITHNRGTVQAARTVYGISMGADSASQVISIRPEEYLQKK